MRRRAFVFGTVAAAAATGAGTVWFRGAASAAAPDVKMYPRDEVLGSKDAPVTIIEYSSLTCGHCAAFHAETLPKLKETYIETGKVRLIFRDFPLGDLALVASMLPHCAGDGRYFGLLDVLFQSQATWAGNPDPLRELVKMARLAGMSKENVDACLRDRALLKDIQERAREGESVHGITGTPTFIINGKKIVGNLPWKDFEEEITTALAASGAG